MGLDHLQRHGLDGGCVSGRRAGRSVRRRRPADRRRVLSDRNGRSRGRRLHRQRALAVQHRVPRREVDARGGARAAGLRRPRGSNPALLPRQKRRADDPRRLVRERDGRDRQQHRCRRGRLRARAPRAVAARHGRGPIPGTAQQRSSLLQLPAGPGPDGERRGHAARHRPWRARGVLRTAARPRHHVHDVCGQVRRTRHAPPGRRGVAQDRLGRRTRAEAPRRCWTGIGAGR